MRYHGSNVYGRFGSRDLSWQDPREATPAQVLSLLGLPMPPSPQTRERALALRYGFVDLDRHRWWVIHGVALHVVIGGRDETTRTRWFHDEATEPDGGGFMIDGQMGRAAELYVLEDGHKHMDMRTGRPVTETARDFVVLPTRVYQHGFDLLSEDEIAAWLGPPREPAPRRALDLRGAE